MNNQEALLKRSQEYTKKLNKDMEKQGIHKKKFFALHENHALPAEQRLRPGPENKATLAEFTKDCDNVLSTEELNILNGSFSQ